MSLFSETSFNTIDDSATEPRPARDHATSRPQKVALITLDFPPDAGGVQQYLYEVSRRIGRHCQLTVVATGSPRSIDANQPFHMTRLPAGTQQQFARVLRELRPDVVIVGHAHPRLLLPAIRSRRRYISVAHGNDFESAQARWHAPLFNRMLARAQPVVTNSHANARRLQELGIEAPAVVLPGTDPERFTPPAQPPTQPPVLLSVGRLVPRKGVDTVLTALPALVGHTPHLEYWIAGDGPQRPALQQLANDLDIAHAVSFLGQVPDNDLPALYRRASLFVMPSRTERSTGEVEGFGIVFLEAGASGLPVIAAHGGGVEDAVRNGETGLIVPPDDPAALTQAVTRLLENPEAAREMGLTARRWVEQEMNWDRAAGQFRRILDSNAQ